MSNTDEQIVQGFLNNWPLSGEVVGKAFERIIARTVPELAEGWYYTAMYQTDVIDPKRDGWLIEIGKGMERSTGEGPTPRAACEAALAKIGKQS